MRKFLLFTTSFLFLSIFLNAQTISPDFQDGKIWFKVKSDARIASALQENHLNLPFGTLPFLNSLMESYSITELSRPFYAAKNSPVLQRTFMLQFSDYVNVDAIIHSLKMMKEVEYAERVPLNRSCLTPNDPSFASQWHLNTIGATLAWNTFSTGSSIRIAIVDDAIERTHPDLAPNLWVNAGEIPGNSIDDDNNGYVDDMNGFDVSTNTNNPNPPNNSFDHGTHVAGIASAATNNNVGVSGIGYSCKLMCIKASTQVGSVTHGYEGIVYAVVSGARVINMSWGGTGSSTTAQNVISWADQEGVVLVAAAGNSSTNSMFYPAGYIQCIAVAATSSNDSKAGFSNYGTWVDISAPGNNIYSTIVGASYGNKSGTSMASPLVAGLCGLMLSANQYLTPADIRSCLNSTATNINTQNPTFIGQLGSGRINAGAAMQCVTATLVWPPVAAFTANITTCRILFLWRELENLMKPLQQ